MGQAPRSIATSARLGLLFWVLGVAPLCAAEEENPLEALREAARGFVAEDLGLREEEIRIPPSIAAPASLPAKAP